MLGFCALSYLTFSMTLHRILIHYAYLKQLSNKWSLVTIPNVLSPKPKEPHQTLCLFLEHWNWEMQKFVLYHKKAYPSISQTTGLLHILSLWMATESAKFIFQPLTHIYLNHLEYLTLRVHWIQLIWCDQYIGLMENPVKCKDDQSLRRLNCKTKEFLLPWGKTMSMYCCPFLVTINYIHFSLLINIKTYLFTNSLLT